MQRKRTITVLAVLIELWPFLSFNSDFISAFSLKISVDQLLFPFLYVLEGKPWTGINWPAQPKWSSCVFSWPVRRYREPLMSLWSWCRRGLGSGHGHNTLNFNIKIFLCDRQRTVRRAIPYGNRTCFYTYWFQRVLARCADRKSLMLRLVFQFSKYVFLFQWAPLSLWLIPIFAHFWWMVGKSQRIWK